MISWGAATVARFFGRVLGGPAELARASYVATLSVAEVLLRQIKCGLANDIGEYKKAFLNERSAKAAIIVAEAAQAANKTSLQRRNNAVHAAESRLKLLQLKGKIADEQEKQRRERIASIRACRYCDLSH